MDDTEKEYYINWIIADYTPFEFDDRSYFISTPSRSNRFLAERFFMSVYNDGINNGLYDRDGIAQLLVKNLIWNYEKESTLQRLIGDIDNIKVWIYENFNNHTKKKQFKQALKDTEEYITKLLIEKQTFDTYDASYVAGIAKQHYLMGSSIFRAKDKPLFKKWWSERDDEIVQYAYSVVSEYVLSDSDYRELARSTLWRNIWNSRRSAGNLLGKSAVDLSIQQKQLIMWSNIYDNIYKNSECPSDDVFEDDDALDGWMILQRRKRDKDSNKQSVDKAIANPRIKNSGHIYIMCDPNISPDVIVDDPNKVYECNDMEGKIRLQRIMSQIQKEKSVTYMGLKDTQMEIFRRSNEMKG